MSVLARSIPCFSSRASFLAALSSDQQQQKNNFNCQRNTVFNEEHNYVKIEGFLSYKKKVLLSPSFYLHINLLKKRLKEFTWIIISPFADDLMVLSIWDWDKPLAAVSWVSNSRLWFCKRYVFLKTTTTLYRKKEKMTQNCHEKSWVWQSLRCQIWVSWVWMSANWFWVWLLVSSWIWLSFRCWLSLLQCVLLPIIFCTTVLKSGCQWVIKFNCKSMSWLSVSY